MEKPVTILAFAGSARRDSFNRKLIKVAATAAEEAGARVTLLELGDYPMPLYHGDEEERDGAPENCLKLQQMVHGHHGLLIATPEYNSFFPPLLKNTLDWLSRETANMPGGDCYRGKAVGLLSASPGRLGGMRALANLRAQMTALGCIVHPASASIGQAYQAFDDDGGLLEDSYRKMVDEVVTATISLAARIS